MDSIEVEYSIADTAFEGAVDAATLYSEHAKAAGIEIEVVREPDRPAVVARTRPPQPVGRRPPSTKPASHKH